MIDRTSRFCVIVVCLIPFLSLASIANAASYQKTDGSIVDPILLLSSSPHGYSGPDLEPGVDATGAQIPTAILIEADLAGATLIGSNFSSCRLDEADMSFADLSNADLRGVTLTAANLEGVDLSVARMDTGFFDGAVLRDANLWEANLDAAWFTGADLSGARLDYASLLGTQLESADLTDVELSQAFLYLTNLSGANLTNVDLTVVSSFADVDLTHALLINANLSGFDLSGVNVTGINFRSANLSNVAGLDATTGVAYYDADTNFAGTGFDPQAAGWILLQGTLPLPSLGPVSITALVVLMGGMAVAGLGEQRVSG